MLCAKTLKAAKAALIIILGAWATTSAHAVMSLSGGTHAPAVYAAETVSTKGFNSLVATNTTFMVMARSDVSLPTTGTYHYRYDLSGATGLAVFGSGIQMRIDARDTPGEAGLTAGTPSDPVRAQPTNLVFSDNAAIVRKTPDNPLTTTIDESMNTGNVIQLLLDGAHPLGGADGTTAQVSQPRAARVSVRGADSGGATYKFMLRLRIYGDLASALSGTGPTLYDSGQGGTPIIAIDPTLSVEVKASDDLVADVLHNFVKFQSGSQGAISGELATVNLKLKTTHCAAYNADATCKAGNGPWPIMPAGAGDGMVIGLSDVLGSSSLVVLGDHSLVDLMLGTRALTLRDNLAKALETHAEGDNKGQYKDRALAVDSHIAGLTAGSMSLTANVGAKNASPIPPGSYTATVALTPKHADAAPVAGVSAVPAGTIVTNGTMVHLGYLTGHDGYNQRVIIANRGKVDASYVVSNILTEDGTAASAGHAATGTVPAESQVVVSTADMISFDSGMTRAAATLSLTAPTSAISVSTTIVNLGDGSTDTSSHMVQ